MSRRRLLLAAAVALVLVAAAFLAALAVAVFADERSLAATDVGLSRPGASSRAVDRPGGPLAGTAGTLLGTGDDWKYREALGLFADLELQPPGAPEGEVSAHGQVEALLSEVADDTADPQRAAAAANLAGVLYVQDAELDRTARSRFLQLGLESFREAVRLDPANGEAKLNLELLVRLLATSAVGGGDDSGSQGSTGAGSSPGGSGY